MRTTTINHEVRARDDQLTVLVTLVINARLIQQHEFVIGRGPREYSLAMRRIGETLTIEDRCQLIAMNVIVLGGGFPEMHHYNRGETIEILRLDC